MIKKTAANHAPRGIAPPGLGKPFFRQSTESGYRMKKASGVLALITDAIPNVFLEIGFAWGMGKPTALMVKKIAGGDPVRWNGTADGRSHSGCRSRIRARFFLVEPTLKPRRNLGTGGINPPVLESRNGEMEVDPMRLFLLMAAFVMATLCAAAGQVFEENTDRSGVTTAILRWTQLRAVALPACRTTNAVLGHSLSLAFRHHRDFAG
jgi:hypothetical protein